MGPEPPQGRPSAGPRERRPGRPVVDQGVRDRALGDLGTTFLLEAGAGTGKTRVLVERYVQCVLDPRMGTGDVRAVVAVTFTEKAAGELRQRVREELESQAALARAASAEAEAIAAALDALDEAPISTIHGFAARLLRDYSVAAGVDPAFEQLDQLGAELERGRLWEEWLTELAAGGASVERPRAWVARLLRAGVRLRSLRELAVGAHGVFEERYDLDPAGEPAGEPDLASGLSGLAGPLARLREFCGNACSDQSDRGCCTALGLVEACERLCAEPPAELDRLAAALYALPSKTTPSAPGGAKGNWSEALGGKDELQERYRAVAAVVERLRQTYAKFVTGLALAVADAFARWAASTQLAMGNLDFTDLLGCLRNLLAGDRAARRALQQRYRYILVDEFQDTDPLQAEIVFYLSEREPLAGDWREVVLEPGKLFLVGDPKQSIYRFRRADIGMYDRVKALVAGQPTGTGVVVPITQNFRTTPAVVDWVNDVFEGVFDGDAAEGRQPRYQQVAAYRPAGPGPGVAVLLGGERAAAAGDSSGTVGQAETARRDEARAVAALVAEMGGGRATRWEVQNRDVGAAEAGGREPARSPRWGDIALLYRSTTGLETLENALREAGVPYSVDGGKTYFARREVDDVLLCLRAVDDPSDGPAVYGALHSTIFGFSDDELFLFWAAGGSFDLFARDQPAGHEAVGDALGVLRELHAVRVVREPHELVDELVRRVRGAELLAATGAGARQAIANLEKLVDRARAFAGAGGGGLGAFLAWAAEAGDTAGEQESHVDDEGAVVNLLTIHKAKGLEYPIVVLVGGAASGPGSRAEPVVDRAARRLAIKLKAELPNGETADLASPAYAALSEAEREMRASELRRLLYVAATRARDHLVVSLFGPLRTKKGEARADVLLAPIAGALPAPAEITEEEEQDGVLILPPRDAPPRGEVDEAPGAATMVGARGAWRRARAELLERAARPAAATSPSGLEHVDEDVRGGGSGAPPGRARALALGAAVHRVMELCDLSDESSVARLATAVAAEAGDPELAAEAAALATSCWRAAPVRAAAAAAAAAPGAVFRELPVGVLVGDVIVNGTIDLLYADADEWVIVDYKTDREADAGVLRRRYEPQAGAYALAVAAATGRAVREAVFVAARGDGLTVAVPVDDGLLRRARDDIATAGAAGRAVVPDELAADRVGSE